MDIERARFNMIEQQIRPWDVLDQDVLDLLDVVHREDFVPAHLKSLAFTDMELPLTPQGAATGEVMLQPKLEARMLQEVAPRRHETVLEIGAGSGHMAALLSHRGQSVLTVDINPKLAEMARANLSRAGIANVRVQTGNGLETAARARFGVIVVSGSLPMVPEMLKQALEIGGRLIAVVGQPPVMAAQLITRAAREEWTVTNLFETVTAPLREVPQPERFRF